MPKSLAICLICLCIFGISPAWAQSETSEIGDDDQVSMTEIDVRGTIRREELQSTTATVLTNKDVNSRIYYQPLDIIKQSPGVVVGFYGESGVAPSFQIRGFNAGHGGGDVTMYLDGIPLHDNGHATAYLDTGIIMPIEIESVEIIKGPSSVYYGQHAAGGSLPFQTIKGGNLTRVNLRYGSYNDINASGLLAREKDNLAHVYAFEVFHTDGYRPNSDWDKKNFSGRWTYKFSDSFSASFNIRAYQSEWDSAGYISKLYDNPKTGWVNDGSGQGNGGKRERYDGRLWANWFINDESQLTLYLYGTTLDHTRWQISRTSGSAAMLGSGNEQTNTHKSWGTGLTYSFKGFLFDKISTATFGVTYMYEKEDPNQRYRLAWGKGRTRDALTSNVSYSLSNPSFLGEFTHQILDQLNIRLGARYDILKGDYVNNLANNGVVASSPKYTFLSPKVGLIYTPLDWLAIYANYGRGFSTPGLSTNATTGFYAGNAFDLSSREQWELGTRLSPLDWLDIELAGFIIKTKNDTSYDAITETSAPIGETTRKGIEFSLSARALQYLEFKANYAFTDAKYDKYFSGNAANYSDYRGLRLANVPRQIANLELSYSPPIGFGGRLSWRYEGDSYLRNVPSHNVLGVPIAGATPARIKAQNKDVVDLQLNYKFNDNYRVVLDVINLFDKELYGSEGYPDPTRNGHNDFTYSLRPPRTFYLGLEMNWDQ
jgi:iron complex outermembrane receptor protein